MIPIQVRKYRYHAPILHVFIIRVGQYIYPPELLQWFQYEDKKKLVIKKQEKKTRYRLPIGWKVKDLPPSLKPPPSKHGYEWDNVGSWDV